MLFQLKTFLIYLNLFFFLQSGFFVKELKSLKSKDQIAKALISKCFTGQLCTKITWKQSKKDKRPMFGHLTNLIAVFGGNDHLIFYFIVFFI